jgi:RNA polymerase sigma-70 factor (ECF subfamily)
LDELPPEYGSVLMLWAVEDMSYKEIAVALDIPVGTVMSRLHRARRRLAAQLRPMAIDRRLIRE